MWPGSRRGWWPWTWRLIKDSMSWRHCIRWNGSRCLKHSINSPFSHKAATIRYSGIGPNHSSCIKFCHREKEKCLNRETLAICLTKTECNPHRPGDNIKAVKCIRYRAILSQRVPQSNVTVFHQSRFPCSLLTSSTVWVKKNPPLRLSEFFHFFHKRLRIFNRFFTHLLHVPMYARLQILIQLSPTLTKLCHIKRD